MSKISKQKIKEDVEEAIEDVINRFIELPFSFRSEEDIRALLFCYMYKNKELTKDYPSWLQYNLKKGIGIEIKTKDVLFHTQGPTRKSDTNSSQLFDLVIYSPDEFPEEDIRLVAVELKFMKDAFQKPSRGSCLKDIKKLIRKESEVKHAYLLIMGHRDGREINIKFFEDFKKEVQGIIKGKYKGLHSLEIILVNVFGQEYKKGKGNYDRQEKRDKLQKVVWTLKKRNKLIQKPNSEKLKKKRYEDIPNRIIDKEKYMI